MQIKKNDLGREDNVHEQGAGSILWFQTRCQLSLRVGGDETCGRSGGTGGGGGGGVSES